MEVPLGMAVMDAVVAELPMTPVPGESESQCLMLWCGVFLSCLVRVLVFFLAVEDVDRQAALLSESFAVQASAVVAACSLSLADRESEGSVLDIRLYRESTSRPEV